MSFSYYQIVTNSAAIAASKLSTKKRISVSRQSKEHQRRKIRSNATSRGRNNASKTVDQDQEISKILDLRNLILKPAEKLFKSHETAPKTLKKYLSIRKQQFEVNKLRNKFIRALRMTQEDYMKEFKQKAAEKTTELNRRKPGDGSSAIFNLNMHQDFIVNKLGLIKKLKGHDLIIKTLLFRILGIKSSKKDLNDSDEDKNLPENRVGVTDSYKRAYNKSSHSEHRPLKVDNLMKTQSELYKNKPSTHSGNRVIHLQSIQKINQSMNTINQDLKPGHFQNKSLDFTSNRKINDLSTMDDRVVISKEEQSPRSLINSIIDQ